MATVVVVVSLRVIVVVVIVTVARRRGGVRHEVVTGVKVTEWKLDYFMRLDPATIVELKPLEMYYLQESVSNASSQSSTHSDNTNNLQSTEVLSRAPNVIPMH